MSAALLVTVLVTSGVYLILQRGLVRVAFGFVMIGHAVNVILLAAGGMHQREPAYVGPGADPSLIADPLVQAFALTAIVITFALTVYMLVMAGHGGEDDGQPSDAAPSDASEQTGTVVDAPPTPGRDDHALNTDGQPVGTHPTGEQATGQVTGREHA